MLTGTVKFFNDQKGFGFIKGDDGREVFVHRSGIARAGMILSEGQRVKFETEKAQRGDRAIHVEAA